MNDMNEMEGIRAATIPSAAAKDADGAGNASGNSADERPDLESLNTRSDNGISPSRTAHSLRNGGLTSGNA
jgi:hypothetical protein